MRVRKTKQVEKQATCVACGDAFTYVGPSVGTRRYCSDHCRKKARHGVTKSQPLCVVEGCSNHRRYKDGICNSCFHRRRRTGSLERRTYNYRVLSTHGYVVIWDRKDHPLASPQGMLYEHRAVLFDSIGAGPHACHWCGDSVDWIKGKCAKGALVPDHLDGDKANNDIKNLVPACNKCNSVRGLFMSWVTKHQDDPWLWAMYQRSRAA